MTDNLCVNNALSFAEVCCYFFLILIEMLTWANVTTIIIILNLLKRRFLGNPICTPASSASDTPSVPQASSSTPVSCYTTSCTLESNIKPGGSWFGNQLYNTYSSFLAHNPQHIQSHPSKHCEIYLAPDNSWGTNFCT